MSTLASQAEPTRAASLGEGPTPPGLFPLSATPFERYLAADERPGYPMAFTIEARLRGEVDPKRLNDAIAAACRANPLLSARLAGASWRAGGGTPPSLEDPPNRQPIDPTRENPIRLRWRPNAEGGVLALTVHHAACDGIGAISFFGDTVSAYNGGGCNGVGRSAVEALQRRGWVDRSDLPPVSAWQANRYFARELWRLAVTRPAVLRSHATDDAPARLRTLRLGRDLIAAASRALRSRGATLNTGLLACAFAAVAGGGVFGRRGSLIRITTPFNLRDGADRNLTAANKIGYAFLDRPLSQANDASSLVSGLQADVDAIQKWKLAAGFSDALGRFAALPGGLWAATRLSGAFSTLVLSNVGDPRRRCRVRAKTGAAVTLEAVRGAPPVRPGTAMAVGVTADGGGLLVTYARDPARLTEADADALLLAIGQQLQRMAGMATGLGEVADGFPE